MGELKLIKLADIRARNVEWLWEPYLPKGKVSILRGHPGEGKSMFIMALISAAEGQGIDPPRPSGRRQVHVHHGADLRPFYRRPAVQ